MRVTARKKGLSEVSLRMLDLLKSEPSGLTLPQMRLMLKLGAHEHIHLDRRLRDLDPFYEIDREQRGTAVRYVYRGERLEPLAAAVNLRVRAEVIHRSRGRCGMCGRTVNEDEVKLVVDHKVPQEWGGSDDPENLWAVCEECNAGKKNYFSSFDPFLMRKVMNYESPHMRIGELLKSFINEPVPSWMIEFVAQDQTDWPKRTRDLRYLGWEIEVRNRKNPETSRVESYYTLRSFKPWPRDPTKWIREFEAERARQNRAKKG